MIIYLSGGMSSNWREIVMESTNHIFLNPLDHKLQESSQYAIWDLLAIKQCDVLFAYMERNNPSGYGLSLETGYAKALGKTIILVDEKRDPKMAIVRCCADVLVSDLYDGISVLRSLELI